MRPGNQMPTTVPRFPPPAPPFLTPPNLVFVTSFSHSLPVSPALPHCLLLFLLYTLLFFNRFSSPGPVSALILTSRPQMPTAVPLYPGPFSVLILTSGPQMPTAVPLYPGPFSALILTSGPEMPTAVPLYPGPPSVP
jgi:hypothetical protein